MQLVRFLLEKAAPVILLLIIFSFSLRGVYGEDIWFHLATGRVVWQTGQIPLTDVFSHTAAGKEWINQNWLADVAFFLIFRAFGQLGLAIFFAGLTTLIFWLLYLTLKRLGAARNLCLLVTFLTAFFAIPRFQARPETGSYLFIMYLIYLLLPQYQKAPPFVAGMNVSFFKTGLLFFLWANWQSGFTPFGLMILGAWITFFGLRNYFSPAKNRLLGQAKKLWLLPTALIAGLLSPVGFTGMTYFLAAGPQILKQDFTEWGSLMRILGSGSLALKDRDLAFLLIGYLGGLGLLGAALFYKLATKPPQVKMRAAFFASANNWVFLLCPLIFLPWIAYRFIPLSLLVSAVILVKLVKDGLTVNLKYLRWSWIWLVAAAILLRWFLYPPILVAGDNKEPFRHELIEFLDKNQLQGNLFNPLEDGGYLIWHAPERPVFIDQRLDVYTLSGVYQEYKQVYAFPPPPSWSQVLNKYQTELILLPGWQDEPVTTILASGKYSLVYWSDYFFLLIKNTGANQDFVKSHKISLVKPFAKTEYAKDSLGQVIEETVILQQRSPISANVWVTLGNLYQQSERRDEAIASFEKALTINKRDWTVRLNLGTLYVENKECDRALTHLQTTVEDGDPVSRSLALRNTGFIYLDCLGNLRLAYANFAKFVKSGRKAGIKAQLLEEASMVMQKILPEL